MNPSYSNGDENTTTQRRNITKMALTQDDRRRGQANSTATKRRRMLQHAQTVEIVTSITQELDRQELGPEFLKLAHQLALRAGNAEITPETALEIKQLADAAQILHKMGRLELGESTANTAIVNVTDAFAKQRELDARLAKLRDADPQGA